MKYTWALAFFLCWQAVPLLAQSAGLLHFNQTRLDRTRNAMYVLGAWGVGNVVAGAIGMSQSKGSQRAFHQMNLGWGAVNLGLAASGLWTATHTDPSAFDLYQTTLEHHRLQKILLFNAGLDVAYMAGGAWMMERAKTSEKHAERLRGFGRSILLQGAFLFVFDTGACLYLGSLGKRLPPLFSQLSTSFDGQSLYLTWQF